MNRTTPSLMQDRQIRKYYTFLLTFCLLLLMTATLFCRQLTDSAKTMLLSHDKAVASSLIEQGVPENIIAKALTDDEAGQAQTGADLLEKLGIVPSLDAQFLPHLHSFRNHAWYLSLAALLPICLLLLSMSLLFLHKRDKLYRHAFSIIDNYIDGDYSCRLPQTDEGTIYQVFSSVDRLATMLQAQNETEYRSKIFLRNMISDISHQLRTPLAALSMYQEIMENEPDHPAVIQKFTAKTELALNRMEQLIESMLKITRLDAGSIIFEKRTCNLSELVSHAVNELTTRAASEGKTIISEGSPAETLVCDPSWTIEAIGNIVKNALDHTEANGTIHISWDTSPVTTRIMISDNGSGIAPEDIHHIFKRFYRSRKSSDTQGIGLGLSLAKSIIEGQGGSISVQSRPHMGTTFTILFTS
ncbi:MAG: HAMP domain-containing histidine kinase [Lachnospiraceae bacterium]|nr:HAMP domain-containing histidine kinase [Lachnospiraceae bacterium]